MNQRKTQAAAGFKTICGYEPTTFVQAPGRVNLIGEHTDYNDGFVMPCAINYCAVVACAKREDDIIRLISVDYDNATDEFKVGQTIEPTEDKLWANYMRGVVHFLKQRGYEFGGADIAVSGNVPLGSGLSSSAALEVVTGQALKTLYDLDVSQTDLALIAQQAEHHFAGSLCGIMDQLISACGEQGSALFIDCRSLEKQAVSIPDNTVIMIVNSNIKHSLVDGEYNSRRRQCETAAAKIGVKALRDADMVALNSAISDTNSEVYRRARHVITENARTQAMVEVLQNGDLSRAGELMAQSHASMRDDFEITTPEIDFLAETLQTAIGDKGGARMTGGGFGGCVVALLPAELVDTARTAVENSYQAQTGIKESIYICTAQAGAGVLA